MHLQVHHPSPKVSCMRQAATSAARLLRLAPASSQAIASVHASPLINSSSQAAAAVVAAAVRNKRNSSSSATIRAANQQQQPTSSNSQMSEPDAKRARTEEGAGSSSPGRRRRKPLADDDIAPAPAPPAASVEAAPPAAVNGSQPAPPPAPAAAPQPQQQPQPAAQAPVQQQQSAQPQQQQATAGQLPPQGQVRHQHSQASSKPPQQQQQKQKQQKQQQQQKGGKKGKKQRTPFLGTFYQCVKRELPYEAVHVYQKIKEASAGQGQPVDLSLCNSLLSVAVGNWQWELHQRHQFLQRQYEAEGRDTAALTAALEACLAVEREHVLLLQQAQAQQQQQEDGAGGVPHIDVPEVVTPAGTPAAMVCHVQRNVDKSLEQGLLHSRDNMPDQQLFDDLPQERKPMTQLMRDVMDLVLADTQAAGTQPDEQLLMGLARVAGIMGDADKAYEYAKQVVSGAAAGGGRIIPRLRDFHPALVGYALTGQADKAGQVVRDMLQHCKPGDLTECEFALWLEAIAVGGSYAQMSEVLHMVSQELNQLAPKTLALVQRFFESDRAAAALAPGGALAGNGSGGGGGSWQQQWVVPDETGHVAEAGATLSLVDLTEADWQLFDDQVFKLGTSGESLPGEFARFQQWVDRHGPFDLTLDGANLAFWGENYAQGGFRCWKVRVAFDHMQGLYPNAKILVILHQNRVYQTSKDDQETSRWLDHLRRNNQLYVTPRNMNDDMFWMYAPIRGRAASRLVSHDQMRDHVWSMLRPKHMLKWRQRHVIDYTFSYDKCHFNPLEPTPYTPCVQEVKPGVWLLPLSTATAGGAATGEQQQQEGGGTWLLCQPAQR